MEVLECSEIGGIFVSFGRFEISRFFRNCGISEVLESFSELFEFLEVLSFGSFGIFGIVGIFRSFGIFGSFGILDNLGFFGSFGKTLICFLHAGIPSVTVGSTTALGCSARR